MKILEILTQSKETLEKEKAKRVAKALARKQEALIDALEDQRDTLIAKKEALLSVTSSTVNQGTWNAEYQDAQVNLFLLEKQINIAKSTQGELFKA